jgi:hypothetical protein
MLLAACEESWEAESFGGERLGGDDVSRLLSKGIDEDTSQTSFQVPTTGDRESLAVGELDILG